MSMANSNPSVVPASVTKKTRPVALRNKTYAMVIQDEYGPIITFAIENNKVVAQYDPADVDAAAKKFIELVTLLPTTPPSA